MGRVVSWAHADADGLTPRGYWGRSSRAAGWKGLSGVPVVRCLARRSVVAPKLCNFSSWAFGTRRTVR